MMDRTIQLMLTALKQVEAEMRAGMGSHYGETREQVRRAIRAGEESLRNSKENGA